MGAVSIFLKLVVAEMVTKIVRTGSQHCSQNGAKIAHWGLLGRIFVICGGLFWRSFLLDFWSAKSWQQIRENGVKGEADRERRGCRRGAGGLRGGITLVITKCNEGLKKSSYTLTQGVGGLVIYLFVLFPKQLGCQGFLRLEK